jgi:hypothetical protein
MALWVNHDESSDGLYTTVYFLRDALESALEHAAYLTATVCRKPDLMRGAGHAEISARLNRFRSSFLELQTREAMMVTKLLRAREWAAELKRAAPQIKSDADQFIDATSICETLQNEYVSDPQRLFHGRELPSRYLERRHGAVDPAADRTTPATEYRVGGVVDLLELRVACEVFLSQLDQEFFSDASPNRVQHDESFVSYLQLDDEQMIPTGEESPPQAVH